MPVSPEQGYQTASGKNKNPAQYYMQLDRHAHNCGADWRPRNTAEFVIGGAARWLLAAFASDFMLNVVGSPPLRGSRHHTAARRSSWKR